MTLKQWLNNTGATLFNPGNNPYVLLNSEPLHRLSIDTVRELHGLSDYSFDCREVGLDNVSLVWLRKR